MPEHERDEGEPADNPVDFPRLLIAMERAREETGVKERAADAIGSPTPGQVPLPFPFPIPEPRVPQLPGMPPFREPLPFPADLPELLPGQFPLPDPAQPPLVPAAVQPVAEGAKNLVGGALGMVPKGFQATDAQMMELFGAFAARRGDPQPLDAQSIRIAVAEEGAARIVQKARRERGRFSKERAAAAAAAGVAGLGLGFAVHQVSKGGFGAFKSNFAAELELLTGQAGRRKLEEGDQVGQFPPGTGGSEGGV